MYDKNESSRGAWVAQSVKCLTLDFSSVMISRFIEFEPHVGLRAENAKTAWDSLSPSLCLCPTPVRVVSRSLRINLKKKKKKNPLGD